LSGKLFIIGTPIGNLEDISQRVINALRGCSLIFVEDTRVSVKLLNHLGLSVPMLSCHRHNEHERLRALEKAASDNASVGLLSDAGMPLISDPGEPLIQKAIELNMEIIPIAGPTAFVLALVASGFDLSSFAFEGFLPDKESLIIEKLARLKGETRTLVFYVSPHKLATTLKLMLQVLGDRRACLARELTKFYEEFVRLPLSELSAKYEELEPRGELVLVLEGASASSTDYSDWQAVESQRQEVLEHVKRNLAHGLKLSKAAALAAEYFSIGKSDIYRASIAELKDSV